MSKKIPDADDVFDRLSQVLGCKNDTELAESLKMARTTLSSKRTRGSVPYAECVTVALRGGYLLDWLLLGRGGQSLGGAADMQQEAPATYDGKLLTLQEATHRVMKVAQERTQQPDVMRLQLLRDLTYRAGLSDDKIRMVFDLLEQAPEIYGYNNETK